MYSLYPDQQRVKSEIYNAWRKGHKRIILGASTGSGKTIVAIDIIQDAINKNKIPLFIVDRIQLVNQTAKYLQELGLRVSIYQGANSITYSQPEVIVASIQTLARRRHPEIDLIIIDEVHVFHNAHKKLLDAYDNVFTLGLSATPMRKDLGQYFTKLVRAPSIGELIKKGRLVPFVCYGPSQWDLQQVKKTAGDFNQKQLAKACNKLPLVADIVKTWKELGQNRQTICFAVDIAHSKNIARQFNEADIPAAHLDTYTQDNTRIDILRQFREGHFKVLVSVGILSIGFDEPSIGCVISARPTMSKMLFIQQAGRGPRTYPGKQDVILLDHAGNCERMGLLPQDFVIPPLTSLDIKQRKTKAKKPSEPVPCEQCRLLVPIGATACPQCGWERQKPSLIQTIDGKLKRLAPMSERKKFVKELVYLMTEQKKNLGYAYHLYKRKYGEEPPINIWHAAPEVPSDATRKWYRSQLIRYAHRRAG